MNKPGGGVYFEFVRRGVFVKVSAIDADTGTEVSIIAPAAAPPEVAKRIALQKLRYVLRKQL